MPLKAYFSNGGDFRIAVNCVGCGRPIYSRGNIVWKHEGDYEFTHKNHDSPGCDDPIEWPYSADLWMPQGVILMKGNER